MRQRKMTAMTQRPFWSLWLLAMSLFIVSLGLAVAEPGFSLLDWTSKGIFGMACGICGWMYAKDDPTGG